MLKRYIERHTDLLWVIYAILCVAYWAWLLHPHAIPQSQLADEVFILAMGGGFALFGFFGSMLNEHLLKDKDIGTLAKLVICAGAALIAGLLHYLFRGMPSSGGAWLMLIIIFLSIASALYLFARSGGRILFEWMLRGVIE